MESIVSTLYGETGHVTPAPQERQDPPKHSVISKIYTPVVDLGPLRVATLIHS